MQINISNWKIILNLKNENNLSISYNENELFIYDKEFLDGKSIIQGYSENILYIKEKTPFIEYKIYNKTNEIEIIYKII